MTNKQWFRGMKRLHIGVGLGMLVGSACPLLSVGLMALGMIGFFKAGQEGDKEDPKKDIGNTKSSHRHNDVSSDRITSQTTTPNIPQREVNSVQSLRGARGNFTNESYLNRRR